MWGLLLTLAPVLVRIITMILDKNGASEEEKRQVLDMVVKSKDDALTPIKIKDDFKALRAKLKARMNANKVTPPDAEAN